MLKSKYLTKKQKAVLGDLFSGTLSVQEVLEKCKVARQTYNRWHAQPFFAAEFKRLMALAQSETELVLARYASDIAMKLVSLAAAEKEETARKACMDVINCQNRNIKNNVESPKPPVEEESFPEISPEKASKLLDILAAEDPPVKL